MTKRNNAFRRGKQPVQRPPASSASSLAGANLQRAMAFHQAGQLAEAEALYRQILEVSPNHYDALHLLGVMAHQVGKHALALKLIDRAIQINPRDAAAFSNRGKALVKLHQYDTALESYGKAICLNPDFSEAHFHHGNLLYRLHRFQAALKSYDKTICLNPNHAEAYSNRGGALHQLHQYQAAIESYDKAISLKPHHPEAHNNRGTALLELHQYQAALECYDKAILQKPDYAEACVNRGLALKALQQYPAALISYDKAIALKSDAGYWLGERLNVKRFLCKWDASEDDLQILAAGIDRGKKVSTPFQIATLSSSAALQRRAAEIYVRDRYPRNLAAPAFLRQGKQEKIRVGYFSADYHNHATCCLMAELFERHDRSRFEILGFSFDEDPNDAMRERVSAAMDRFIDVRSSSNRAAAELSRELGVDIAVDLKGFTTGHRMGIFAERAAPIQVSYIGYPGTTGADYMDYLIADSTLIPEESQRYYSEKIVYLPDSYQANDSKRPISQKPCTRAEEGLPEQGIVFCCFNNNYKITPEVFDIWMRILARVEGSVLWLLEGNQWAAENLRKEAERRGISAKRLIFAKRLPLAEHLARQSLADLFLDTFPCNAHTTASDALWTGLPVLTRMGETFASRVAASLLRAIDLPELVTTTEAAYEALAVEMAFNSERRHAIRTRLWKNRLTSPLFDIGLYSKHLEAAYTAMFERRLANLAPDHVHIERQADSSGRVPVNCDPE